MGARAAQRHPPEPLRAADRALHRGALGSSRGAARGLSTGDGAAQGRDHQPACADHRPASRRAGRARRARPRSKRSPNGPARHGIAVDVSIDLAYERAREQSREGEAALARHTPELKTAIYRIVQEALANAAKRGDAQRAVVEIHGRIGETVHVLVRDDGVGFDPSADTGGFGVLGMRERVELLDGGLEIDSSPGAGTSVRATLPVQRRAGAPTATLHELRGG